MRVIQDEENPICAICLDEQTLDHQSEKTRCHHIFHKRCLDILFNRNPRATCPLCRFKDFRPLPGEFTSFTQESEKLREIYKKAYKHSFIALPILTALGAVYLLAKEDFYQMHTLFWSGVSEAENIFYNVAKRGTPSDQQGNGFLLFAFLAAAPVRGVADIFTKTSFISHIKVEGSFLAGALAGHRISKIPFFRNSYACIAASITKSFYQAIGSDLTDEEPLVE